MVSTMTEPGEHIGGGKAEIRHNRGKCGAKRMTIDMKARHAKSPQGPDVRHGKRISQRRLHEPRHDGDLRQSKRDHRQDLVLPGAIVPAADRKDVKRQTKSKLEERRDNEDGQNNSE